MIFFKILHFSRFLKFTSTTCCNGWIHLILSEHDKPNTIELDSSIL